LIKNDELNWEGAEKFRKFAIRPLFDSNFDSLAYTDQIVDNATLQVGNSLLETSYLNEKK